MVHKVNIEIMVDTNANSRKIDGQYESVREMAEQQEAQHARAIGEFRDYLKMARRNGIEYDVTQRDTAQIFHEKTHLMTPELAAQAGHEIWPNFLRENLEQGHYRVEPPIHGEEAYYDALTTFLYKILPDKAPEDVKKLDSITPQNRGLVLQEMYLDHMRALPGKYRAGKYRKAFKEYRETRFNAGEITAINFLKSHELPPEGEKTAFVFVGSDQWANEQMEKARAGMRKQDKGKFEVFVVPPQQFHQLMTRVISDIEKTQPQMRNLRQASYRELSHILGETPAPRPIVPEKAQPDIAQSFSDFVTRQRQESRDESRGR